MEECYFEHKFNCGVSFSTFAKLKQHLYKIHHCIIVKQDTGKQFLCQFCGKKLSTAYSLKRHEQGHI